MECPSWVFSPSPAQCLAGHVRVQMPLLCTELLHWCQETGHTQFLQAHIQITRKSSLERIMVITGDVTHPESV